MVAAQWNWYQKWQQVCHYNPHSSFNFSVVHLQGTEWMKVQLKRRFIYFRGNKTVVRVDSGRLTGSLIRWQQPTSVYWLTAAHTCVPTLKPPVLLVAVYLSCVYKPTHQTRAFYPTLCGLKYIIIPPPAGKFKRRTKTHSAQSMALKCNRFSSFFAHAYSYICIIIIYVTRPVSIVCYKKHNPFFPQEFEIEHREEMKAKL